MDFYRELLKDRQDLVNAYDPVATTPREAKYIAQEKQFLQYRYIYGYTVTQCAAKMGVDRSTVYRIITRIKSREVKNHA